MGSSINNEKFFQYYQRSYDDEYGGNGQSFSSLFQEESAAWLSVAPLGDNSGMPRLAWVSSFFQKFLTPTQLREMPNTVVPYIKGDAINSFSSDQANAIITRISLDQAAYLNANAVAGLSDANFNKFAGVLTQGLAGATLERLVSAIGGGKLKGSQLQYLSSAVLNSNHATINQYIRANISWATESFLTGLSSSVLQAVVVVRADNIAALYRLSSVALSKLSSAQIIAYCGVMASNGGYAIKQRMITRLVELKSLLSTSAFTQIVNGLDNVVFSTFTSYSQVAPFFANLTVDKILSLNAAVFSGIPNDFFATWSPRDFGRLMGSQLANLSSESWRLLSLKHIKAISADKVWRLDLSKLSGPQIACLAPTQSLTTSTQNEDGFLYIYKDSQGRSLCKVQSYVSGGTTWKKSYFTLSGVKIYSELFNDDGTTSAYTYDALGKNITHIDKFYTASGVMIKTYDQIWSGDRMVQQNCFIYDDTGSIIVRTDEAYYASDSSKLLKSVSTASDGRVVTKYYDYPSSSSYYYKSVITEVSNLGSLSITHRDITLSNGFCISDQEATYYSNGRLKTSDLYLSSESHDVSITHEEYRDTGALAARSSMRLSNGNFTSATESIYNASGSVIGTDYYVFQNGIQKSETISLLNTSGVTVTVAKADYSGASPVLTKLIEFMSSSNFTSEQKAFANQKLYSISNPAMSAEMQNLVTSQH